MIVLNFSEFSNLAILEGYGKKYVLSLKERAVLSLKLNSDQL